MAMARREEIDCLFACKMQRAHTLFRFLSPLEFGKKDTACTVSVTRKGAKFTTEVAQCMQASVFFQLEHFQTFDVREDVTRIRVPIHTFLQCLDIFGYSSIKPTVLQMIYRRKHDPLVLILNDGSVVTDVTLNTLQLEPLTDFNFRSSPPLVRGIVVVTLLFSPTQPYFRLSTTGGLGSCQVDLGNDENLFETFECQREESNIYRLSMLQPCIKALGMSLKTQFRVNEMGVLSLQHMCKTDEGTSCFVDFLIAPNDDELSDDE